MPRRELRRLLPELEAVTLTAGQVLYEPGHALSHVYFPEEAIVSVVCCPSVDRALEVAVIAHEGFVGSPLLLDPPRAISQFVVHRQGSAKRVPREPVQELLESSPETRQLAARFSQALFDQVMLCAACNVGHSPGERCARWLLMMHDRVPGDDFIVTQEVLGYMLGVSRQTVSGIARALQDQGSIDYSRGRVRIADREKLEQLACPCYGAIRDRLKLLLR